MLLNAHFVRSLTQNSKVCLETNSRCTHTADSSSHLAHARWQPKPDEASSSVFYPTTQYNPARIVNLHTFVSKSSSPTALHSSHTGAIKLMKTRARCASREVTANWLGLVFARDSRDVPYVLIVIQWFIPFQTCFLWCWKGWSWVKMRILWANFKRQFPSHHCHNLWRSSRIGVDYKWIMYICIYIYISNVYIYI